MAGRLRLARQEKGFSQEEAAELLSLNRRTIHAWESGEAQPSPDTLDKAVMVYEKTTDWFLGGWSDVNLDDLVLARRINALSDRYRVVVKRVIGALEED